MELPLSDFRVLKYCEAFPTNCLASPQIAEKPSALSVNRRLVCFRHGRKRLLRALCTWTVLTPHLLAPRVTYMWGVMEEGGASEKKVERHCAVSVQPARSA